MITPSKTKPRQIRSNLEHPAKAAPLVHPRSQQAAAAFQTTRSEARRAANEREMRTTARCHRILAANDAVAAYAQASGTRSYQAAFRHIQCTRPELFAGMQDPSNFMAAANYDPYHDALGRFTTSAGAVAPHGHRQRPDSAARPLAIDAVALPHASENKDYQGKISAGAYFQPHATGECLIAIARETITQIETVRTDRDEPLPKGADSSMRALQYEVEKYGEKKGKRFDFSQATKGHGASIQDALPVLSEKFNIHSQPVAIDQIPNALKHGPIMVAVYDGGSTHGELIIGMDKDRKGNDIPGSYRVYNPLNPVARAATLDASEIVRDNKGRPVLFALRPYLKGEKHP